MTQRNEFTTATKKAAWERCGGRCEGMQTGYVIEETRTSWASHEVQIRCDAPIDIGCFHYDHIDNVWTSQDNSLENCQVLCLPCHKEKTKRDVKQIAKTKRIIAKQSGKRSRNPLPFGRSSLLKKKLDGRIVSRAPKE